MSDIVHQVEYYSAGKRGDLECVKVFRSLAAALDDIQGNVDDEDHVVTDWEIDELDADSPRNLQSLTIGLKRDPDHTVIALYRVALDDESTRLEEATACALKQRHIEGFLCLLDLPVLWERLTGEVD
jgi:hypothetical protein